jgi:hypothetical protein
MPESQVRKDVVGSRREGRRSLSAYGAHARGTPLLANGPRRGTPRSLRRDDLFAGATARDISAGMALALVYPFVRRARSRSEANHASQPLPSQSNGSEGAGMKRKPSIKSLDTVSLDEAIAYLDYANGDELDAAYALAVDRARLDGAHQAPDDAEVHHALFLLCRARGRHAPSFDEMRVELRRRLAA